MFEYDMTTEEYVRCRTVISIVFRGLHNAPGLHDDGTHLSVNTTTDLSTFDSSCLTSLVFAAHDQNVRATVEPSGPRMIKITLHARSLRKWQSTSYYDHHPTLEEAVDVYRKLQPKRMEYAPTVSPSEVAKGIERWYDEENHYDERFSLPPLKGFPGYPDGFGLAPIKEEGAIIPYDPAAALEDIKRRITHKKRKRKKYAERTRQLLAEWAFCAEWASAQEEHESQEAKTEAGWAANGRGLSDDQSEGFIRPAHEIQKAMDDAWRRDE